MLTVVLPDGRKLTVTGFKDAAEMVDFSAAIDPDSFEFRTIEMEMPGAGSVVVRDQASPDMAVYLVDAPDGGVAVLYSNPK